MFNIRKCCGIAQQIVQTDELVYQLIEYSLAIKWNISNLILVGQARSNSHIEQTIILLIEYTGDCECEWMYTIFNCKLFIFDI